MTANPNIPAPRRNARNSHAHSWIRRLPARTTLLVLALSLAPAARACSVCFGNKDTPVTQAANGAILFMLAVLIPVLAGFFGFIVYLVRKQSEPLPEHALVARMLDEDGSRNGGDPPDHGI